MSGLRLTTEGVLFETPLAGGAAILRKTFTCCHCGGVEVERKGSGTKRGFCLLCGAKTCGSPACDSCIPIERQLENLEAHRPILTPAPVCVSVPRSL